MLVTLMSKDKLYGILLPEKVCGRYWIEDYDLELANPARRILSIEGGEGIWKVHAGKKIKLSDFESSVWVSQLELKTGKMYTVELPGAQAGYLFTESYTVDRCT